jgi:GTPase involved in cell partitioning and DNA repair
MDILQLVIIAGTLVLLAINSLVLAWLPMYINRKFRERELTTSKMYDVHVESAKVMTEMDMSEVEKQARTQLLTAAKDAAKRLQDSLNNSVDQIASNINDMTSTQLSQEFEKYQVSLQALRDQSITEFNKIQKELDTRKAELLEHLEREVTKEQARRVDQFNTKLNDVVASYLTETLGTQIDLGAQSAYLFAALEQHKEDIKKDILA